MAQAVGEVSAPLWQDMTTIAGRVAVGHSSDELAAAMDEVRAHRLDIFGVSLKDPGLRVVIGWRGDSGVGYTVVRCDGSADAASDVRWQIAAHYAREDTETARREAWERGVE